MNPNLLIRSPYHVMPMTIVLKATKQKVFRQLHCMECGWPIADITDKAVMVFDGETLIEHLMPNAMGLVEVHCGRHQCKQRYRMEFAL